MLKSFTASAALFASVAADDYQRLLVEAEAEYYADYYGDYEEDTSDYYADYYVELNGEVPTVQEPTVQEPTGQEPTGQEPTGQEPTGEEPTGEEPTKQLVIPTTPEAIAAATEEAAVVQKIELSGSFPIGDLKGAELSVFKSGVCLSAKDVIESVNMEDLPWKAGGFRTMISGDAGCQWTMPTAGRDLAAATVKFAANDVYVEAPSAEVMEEIEAGANIDAAGATDAFKAVATNFRANGKKYLEKAAQKMVDSGELTADILDQITQLDAKMTTIVSVEAIESMEATAAVETPVIKEAKTPETKTKPETKTPTKAATTTGIVYIHDDSDEKAAMIGGIVGGATGGIGAVAGGVYYYKKKQAAAAAPSGEP